MKKIFVIICLIVSNSLAAQSGSVKGVVNKFFDIGWKAGLNFNSSGKIKNLTDEFKNVQDAKNAIIGFNVGLYTKIKLPFLYLSPEVYYSKFYTSYETLTVGKSRLEAPVSVGFKLLPVLSVFGGPTYRYDLNTKHQEYTVEHLKGNSTLGIHFGSRLHLGKFGIDVRIEKGISENESHILNANNINIGTIDNRQANASLGISYSF